MTSTLRSRGITLSSSCLTYSPLVVSAHTRGRTHVLASYVIPFATRTRIGCSCGRGVSEEILLTVLAAMMLVEHPESTNTFTRVPAMYAQNNNKVGVGLELGARRRGGALDTDAAAKRLLQPGRTTPGSVMLFS